MEFGAYVTISIILAIEVYYTSDFVMLGLTLYVLLTMAIILLFVILRAASVNKEAKRSHKVLSSLYIMFDKYFDENQTKLSVRLTIMLKVML